MNGIAAKLHRTIQAAGVSIISVSIGKINDPQTWTVEYDHTASAAQRLQGEAIRASFNPDDPAVVNAALDVTAQADIDQNKALQAIVMVTYKYLNPATKPATLALFAKEIRDKYKTL